MAADGAAALADTVAEVPDVAGVCVGVAGPAALPPGLAVRLSVAVPLPPGPQPASIAPASTVPAASIIPAMNLAAENAAIGLQPAKR